MSQLVSVLKTAANLSASLFEHAEDPGFEDKTRTAFRADALLVVGTTQALSVSPANGYDSPGYDPVVVSVREGLDASVAAVPGDATSIHHVRLEVIQAVESMRGVTARPAVAVT